MPIIICATKNPQLRSSLTCTIAQSPRRIRHVRTSSRDLQGQRRPPGPRVRPAVRAERRDGRCHDPGIDAARREGRVGRPHARPTVPERCRRPALQRAVVLPVLIVAAGLVAVVYDSGWFQRLVEAVGAMFTRFKGSRARGDVEAQHYGKTEQAAEENSRVILADCDEDGPATITMRSHIAAAVLTRRDAMDMAMS